MTGLLLRSRLFSKIRSFLFILGSLATKWDMATLKPTTEVVGAAGFNLTPGRLDATVTPPPYAEAWFKDAVEASIQPGPHARRREIVFSVCFVESYLFEWVCDEVIKGKKGKRNALEQYFRPGGA